MTIPNRVRACAEAIAAAGGALDERLDRVDVRGNPTPEVRAELAELAALWVAGGFGLFEAIDSLGDPVAIDALAATEDELRPTFVKAPTAGTVYLLTLRGIDVLLANKDRAAAARQVFIADDFAPFRTIGTLFAPWTQMVPDLVQGDEIALPIPRRIVRDQLAVVPLSVGPLLLTLPPPGEGEVEPPAAIAAHTNTPLKPYSAVFAQWQAAAGPQLLLCLCDEVWAQDGLTHVTLTGPRRRKLLASLKAYDSARDFWLITEAVDWVYGSGRDAETRHTLFVYELAREWPGETDFAKGFAERASGALDAARTAFRMHVRDASKETLKSLQDLRKTLADDVTRVVTQTRELTGTLWRDLLVVVAAVLGRFTLLATPGNGEAAFADALLYGLALYLAFSVGMTLFANASFMSIFRIAQADWQTKLYGFVDIEDYTRLATGPLRDAETIYKRTRCAALVAYGLTIIALIALAVLTPATPTLEREGADQGRNAKSDAAPDKTGSTADPGPGVENQSAGTDSRRGPAGASAKARDMPGFSQDTHGKTGKAGPAASDPPANPPGKPGGLR